MFLQRIDEGGCPVEYLAARIVARRGSLAIDWLQLAAAEDPLAALPPGSFLAGAAGRTSEGMWKALLGEYRWVFRQMDTNTAADFEPFFAWQELKTVILCLRNMQARESAKIDEILGCSLLSRKLKFILAHGGEPSTAVEQLEVEFALVSAVFCGLAEIFRTRGAGGLEHWLNDTWLEWVCETSMHPLLRDFFAWLADFRNLMRLHKWIRWGLPAEARFLRGGRICRASLTDVLRAGDRTAISGLFRRFPGAEGDADPSASPEHYLLRGITRRIHEMSRGHSGYGIIIEYLWLLYVETLNMTILLETGKLDREYAAGELVR